MHDPKFEKAVQEKMEGLSFEPSDAVWRGVERAVEGERKRRLAPIWLFLLPLAMVAGGGAVYYWLEARGHAAGKGGARETAGTLLRPDSLVSGAGATTERTHMTKDVKNGLTMTGSDAGAGRTSAEAGRTDGRTAGTDGNTTRTDEATARTDERVARTEKSMTRTDEKTVKTDKSAMRIDGRTTETDGGTAGTDGNTTRTDGRNAKTDKSTTRTDEATTGSNATTGTNTRTGTHATNGLAVNHRAGLGAAGRRGGELNMSGGRTGGRDAEQNLVNGVNEAAGPDGVSGSAALNRNTVQEKDMKLAKGPGLSDVGIGPGRIGARRLVVPDKDPVKLPQPKHVWEAGFSLGGGVSFVNQGLLDRYSVVTYDYQNAMQAISASPHATKNSVLPGPSFFAGIDLQKGLSRDLSLELGLNLRYYSSRIRTGNKVDQSSLGLSNPVSLLYGVSFIAASARQNYPTVYYIQGMSQEYTNRYYFLELPASLRWQFGHRAASAWYVEGGVNLSYLLGSSALYYDMKSGVYYKSASMINKTQVNVFAGVMKGFNISGLRMQVGPELQYGLTELSKNGNPGQHLLYGGVKLVFLPGKAGKKGR